MSVTNFTFTVQHVASDYLLLLSRANKICYQKEQRIHRSKSFINNTNSRHAEVITVKDSLKI